MAYFAYSAQPRTLNKQIKMINKILTIHNQLGSEKIVIINDSIKLTLTTI